MAPKDPNRAPTIQEVNDADDYAQSKMCIAIPKKYASSGLTYWDPKRKKCTITQGGCGATSSGLLSVDTFTSNGTILEWEKMNTSKNTRKFWSTHPPQQLVWKKVAGRTAFGCSRSNFKFRQFCQFPTQRNSKNEGAFDGNVGKGHDKVPPFTYRVIGGEEKCIIGKDYCDAKAMSYNAVQQECYVPTGQQISEFIYGTTLTRQMRSAGFGGAW
jgi:hypothetical protein